MKSLDRIPLAWDHIVSRMMAGVGAQGFAQAVTVLVRLLELPLFLSVWGVARYGEWLMITAIPTYLVLADGGFVGVAQREMSMRMGGGDRRAAVEAFQTALFVLLAIGWAVITLVAGVLWVAPTGLGLSLTSFRPAEISVLIFVFSIHVVVSFLSGLFCAVYSCQGRYARGTMFNSILALCDFGGLSIGLLINSDALHAACGMLLGRLAGMLILLWDLRSRAGLIAFGVQYASRACARRLISPSLYSIAFPLGEALNNQGMRLAIGLMSDPVSVTIFSTGRTIVRVITKVLTMLCRLIEPELAFAYGAGRADLVRDLFLKASHVTFWFVFPSCILLWFFGDWIMAVWTGKAITFEPTVFLLLLASCFLNAIWYPGLMVPYATNRHGSLAIRFCLVYGLVVLATAGVVNHFGLVGAGLAMVLGEMVLLVMVLLVTFEITGVRCIEWLLGSISLPRLRNLTALKDLKNER